MARLYRNVHIALIAALLLVAIAFQATAGRQMGPELPEHLPHAVAAAALR